MRIYFSIILFNFCLIVPTAKAQIENLNPDFIVISTCHGMLQANILNSYGNENLTEQRSRDLYSVYNQAYYRLLFNNAGNKKLSDVEKTYAVFSQKSLENTFALFENDQFTWDHQYELDSCSALLLKALASAPTPKFFDGFGGNNKQFIDSINKASNKRFDFILSVIEASK